MNETSDPFAQREEEINLLAQRYRKYWPRSQAMGSSLPSEEATQVLDEGLAIEEEAKKLSLTLDALHAIAFEKGDDDAQSGTSDTQSYESQVGTQEDETAFLKRQQLIFDTLKNQMSERGEPYCPPPPLSEDGGDYRKPRSTEASVAGSMCGEEDGEDRKHLSSRESSVVMERSGDGSHSFFGE
jgi:hypothetical protein